MSARSLSQPDQARSYYRRRLPFLLLPKLPQGLGFQGQDLSSDHLEDWRPGLSSGRCLSSELETFRNSIYDQIILSFKAAVKVRG